MIDLHSHILPGLDDGAPDADAAEAMARAALAAGTETIAATPHIREDHPFALEEIGTRTRALQERLDVSGIGLRVVPAGEVALTRCAELGDAELASLALGDGPYLLVESPYSYATDLLETQVFDLQRRGFRPLLAHPERSPSFMEDRERLRTLVSRGVVCSVTAASLTGRFGRTVQGAAAAMVRDGLVHDIASDAHDARRRPPDLGAAVEAVAALLGRGADASWFVVGAPELILAGADVPAPPAAARRRRLLPRR
jgi:protein-tyrosine phosphatase